MTGSLTELTRLTRSRTTSHSHVGHVWYDWLESMPSWTPYSLSSHEVPSVLRRLSKLYSTVLLWTLMMIVSIVLGHLRFLSFSSLGPDHHQDDQFVFPSEIQSWDDDSCASLMRLPPHQDGSSCFCQRSLAFPVVLPRVHLLALYLLPLVPPDIFLYQKK